LLATGAAQCWRYRHVIYPDGSQYLDVARQFATLGPAGLLNGCWSPLYPALIGVAIRIVRPTTYWLFPLVQAVNFVQYAVAVVAFDFFIVAVLAARDRLDPEPGRAWLSPAAVLVGAYASFAVLVEYLLNVRLTSPDMTVAAVVFAVGGLLARATHDDGPRTAKWAAIGALLAIGYLAKTAMFLVALLVIGASFALVRPRSRRGPLVAAALFVLVASPWIASLSLHERRVTYGNTGPLMYAWWVNQWPGGVLWIGEPAESGRPAHPVARVFQKPDVFAFDWPTPVTYAPFYDPTYWNQGISARVYPARQLRALQRTAAESLGILGAGLWALGPVLAIVLLLARGWAGLGARLWALRLVWVPALLSCAIYLIVHVEGRFIAGQLQVAAALMLALVTASTATRIRIERIAAAGCVLAACATAGPVAAGAARHTLRNVAAGESVDASPDWHVAEALRMAGVPPGTRVGVIGNTIDVAWAQLAGVRIVGESPASQLAVYESATPPTRAAAIDALRRAGARAIVARSFDPIFVRDGFARLADSEFAVRLLQPGDPHELPALGARVRQPMIRLERDEPAVPVALARRADGVRFGVERRHAQLAAGRGTGNGRGTRLVP
jgi:hypothetical protein